FLDDIILIDELLEYTAKRLLGDLQDVEQVCNLHARVAVDKMQHAMVRAAKSKLLQHLVGVADEVAIGEEQEFDEVPDRLRRLGTCRLRRGARPAGCRHAGVSHGPSFRSAILTYFVLFVTQRGYFATGSCPRRFGAMVAPVVEPRSHEPAEPYRD